MQQIFHENQNGGSGTAPGATTPLELTAEEAHVISSLALLGSAVTEEDRFTDWVGSRYRGAIGSLAKKSLIERNVDGSKKTLSMPEGIREMVLEQLKPDLRNCAWAKRSVGDIAGELASKAEYAIAGLGAEGAFWQSQDIFDRAKLMMTARLLLSILGALDLAKPENVIFAIDSLYAAIGDDIRRAASFGVGGTSLPERILGSPCFEGLASKHKFEAYNLAGIASAAALCEYFLNVPDDQRSNLAIYKFLCGARHKEEPIGFFDDVETHDDEAVTEYYGKTSALVGRIIEAYLKTESFAGSLPEGEKSTSMPRIYLPLMDFVNSMGSGPIGRKMLFLNSGGLFMHIRDFGNRNHLTGEMRDTFSAAFDDYRFALFPGRCLLKPRTAPDGNEDGCCADPAEDEARAGGEFDEQRTEYYYRVANCESLSEADEIIAELLADQSLPAGDKVYEMQHLVMVLGFNPFQERHGLGYKKRMQKMVEEAKASGIKDIRDLLPCCTIESRIRKARVILARMAPLMETVEQPRLEIICGYNAQRMMVACTMGDEIGVSECVEEYFPFEPSVGGCEDRFPYAITIKFLDTLQSLGYNSEAAILAHRGLGLLDAVTKEPGMTQEQLYVLYGWAAGFAECAGDSARAGEYRFRQLEALGLGYVAGHAQV